MTAETTLFDLYSMDAEYMEGRIPRWVVKFAGSLERQAPYNVKEMQNSTIRLQINDSNVGYHAIIAESNANQTRIWETSNTFILGRLGLSRKVVFEGEFTLHPNPGGKKDWRMMVSGSSRFSLDSGTIIEYSISGSWDNPDREILRFAKVKLLEAVTADVMLEFKEVTAGIDPYLPRE